MTKAAVLYSGGLDSKLVVRILQDQGIEVEALYFNLPFGCGCCDFSFNFKFTQIKGVKMTLFDTTKEPLLSEYLKVIKEAKHGRGISYNPCKDCKIFMFKKAKEYADKNGIDIIATGEVLGQRPMSQIKKAITKIDDALDFEILRPLSAKNLEETSWEKGGLVNRDKFYNIIGRGRKKQIELAKKFNITYPNPGGGCLLCEKVYKKLFKKLIENNLITQETLPLIGIGRHFLIKEEWFVVARNGDECEIVDKFKESVIGGQKIPSVYTNTKNTKKAKELQIAFRTGSSQEERMSFSKFKL